MFKTHTCITLCCDGCGTALEHWDGGTQHYATNDQQGALDDAESHEWHILRDGRVFCVGRKCEDQLPACECVGDECDATVCPAGCPCPLHGEVKPVLIPGQLEIGGAP